MKIENNVVPVVYEFKNLNEGEVFISHDDINKGFVFMKVPESSLLEDSFTEFNAIGLNDGDIYFFGSQEEVEVVDASLIIKPKNSK